jgi:hypothetical protein
MAALLYHGLVFSNKPVIIERPNDYVVTIWIKSRTSLISDSLFLYYKYPSASVFQRTPLLYAGQPNEYYAVVSKTQLDSTSVGYFSASDLSGQTRTLPNSISGGLLPLHPTPGNILQYFPQPSTPTLPQSVQLMQNYPNPFNGFTIIQYDLPGETDIDLAVFNILGQRIKTLYRGIHAGGWNITASWNGRDELGHTVSSGIYIYRLKTKDFLLSQKMLLLR